MPTKQEFYKHTIVIYADQDLSDTALKDIERLARTDAIHIESSHSEEVEQDDVPQDALQLFGIDTRDYEVVVYTKSKEAADQVNDALDGGTLTTMLDSLGDTDILVHIDQNVKDPKRYIAQCLKGYDVEYTIGEVKRANS